MKFLFFISIIVSHPQFQTNFFQIQKKCCNFFEFKRNDEGVDLMKLGGQKSVGNQQKVRFCQILIRILLMYQRQFNKKQKLMQGDSKEDAFDLEFSINFLNDRKSNFSNEEPTSLIPEPKHNQIMLFGPFQQNIGNISLIEEKFLSLDENDSSFSGKIEVKDDQIFELKSSTIIDCSNNQQLPLKEQFRTLRSGKCGPPKPLSIQNQSINRLAKKNSLQFYAYILHRHFNSRRYALSEKQQKMIQHLKKYPCVKNFNELFQSDGNLKIGLIQFFQPSNFWRIILTSRFRHYQMKLIIKKIGQRLRKGLIHNQFKGLSYIKSVK